MTGTVVMPSAARRDEALVAADDALSLAPGEDRLDEAALAELRVSASSSASPMRRGLAGSGRSRSIKTHSMAM